MRLYPFWMAAICLATTLGVSNSTNAHPSPVGKALAEATSAGDSTGKATNQPKETHSTSVAAAVEKSQSSGNSHATYVWDLTQVLPDLPLARPSGESLLPEPPPWRERNDELALAMAPSALRVKNSAVLAQQPTETEGETTPESPELPPEMETETEGDSPTEVPESPQPEAPPETEIPISPPNGEQQQPQQQQQQQQEPQVLVAEVVVEGVEGELEQTVYDAVATTPGRTTTRSQLQEDIDSIYATGYFAQARVVPEDTPLGVRVTFVVEPNPVLQQVQVEGDRILPDSVVQDAFSDQYGEVLNLQQFQNGISQINQWYQDNGYVLAQVVESPQVSEDGTVTLTVAEGEIADIQVQFLTEEGEATTPDGEPIGGRTREYVVLREMRTEPGDILKRDRIQSDLQRIFQLGLFEDVRLQLNPAPNNPRKAVVVVNLIEKNTGSIGVGGGVSTTSGLFGTVSFQEQNLFGRNQKLGAELQAGERGLLFDLSFTDPWIKGDPFGTSYTANVFTRRAISLIFDGGDEEVELENGDRPRVQRFGGGVRFQRPLSNDPLSPAEWTASGGVNFQRVTIRDEDGEITPEDELGNDLSFSGDGRDDLLTLEFGLSRDLRNNQRQPTSGSFARVDIEQSIPVGQGNILFNSLQGRYSYYIPVDWVNFTEGPQTLAFNVEAGVFLGDLPPYEAFALGGSNSVRGYDEAELGTGRAFAEASVEYRFPIISIVGGALFADVGSDLGTADDVPGEPAEVRDKPGSGFGYGLGVRIQSPLGPIRVDYGINDEGEGRLHFGIGEKF
ncbi:BamA/TamA family outer membrane protein [Geitlerinema sp. PCC 9228]|uniref:BamA/TamA family outer membrane protein n=1 Tax=Geitlerinema sp. PCC 9228 TaxID=111611 RepID=UPI0008F9B474